MAVRADPRSGGRPRAGSWSSGCAASRLSEGSIVRLFRRCLPLVLLLALVLHAWPSGRCRASRPRHRDQSLVVRSSSPAKCWSASAISQPFGAGSGVSGAFDRYLSSFGVRSASPAIGDGRTYRLHFDLADDLQCAAGAIPARPECRLRRAELPADDRCRADRAAGPERRELQAAVGAARRSGPIRPGIPSRPAARS